MEWKIRDGGVECEGCSKAFEHQEVYYSVIALGDGGVNRFDYCTACFTALDGARRELFWRTRKTGERSVKKTVNFEILREVFFRMLKVDDQGVKEMAYLIALILVRKRYLRLRDFVTEQGRDYMAVQQKKDTPVVKVEIPLLREEEILGLRDRLSEVLDADLDSTLEISEIRERFSRAGPENPSINASS